MGDEVGVWELRLACRVPPLLLTVLAAALMGAVSQWVPGLSPVWWLRLAFGLALSLLGLSLMLWAVWSMRDHGTSLDPRRPQVARVLVTQGAFAISRHPVYLGLLLLLLGWAVLLANPAAALLVPLWWAWMHWFQVLPEERVLFRKFAVHYDSYAHKVRRWI